MKVKKGKELDFNLFVERNSTDGYSFGVVKYARQWADLLEKEIDRVGNAEEAIISQAEQLSCIADTEGITGFMYGCAVQALSEFWEYGDILRKWHNKEYNYSGDGVVNPAVFVTHS